MTCRECNGRAVQLIGFYPAGDPRAALAAEYAAAADRAETGADTHTHYAARGDRLTVVRPLETKEATPCPGLGVKPAPLFPDHPDACFVIHIPSNRRMPATWTSTAAAQRFIETVRDTADWTKTNVTGTKTLAQAIDDHNGTWDSFGVPRLPTPPYLPTHAEIADVLDRALAVLTANGWCQGDAFTFHDTDQELDDSVNPDQCRVCLRGAVNIAAEGHPLPPEVYEPGVLADAAVTALAETLGVDDVTVWNDAADRTAVEVRDVLTRTIDRLCDDQATAAKAPTS